MSVSATAQEQPLERLSTIPAAADESSYLVVQQLSKRFGNLQVLDQFDLRMSEGEFITLLGPSGCGKTTLLRLIAGLLVPDSGSVVVNGRDITKLPAHRRKIGMVFQSYALFPHMVVFENVAFGLRARRRANAEIAERVARALELVRLEGYARRPVTHLSGGQQQRVSLARAIVVEPSLFLFDEPFSALDRKLRETMQIEMRQILRRVGATALFVTHDQDEALVLSDRIVVMNEGKTEQVGTPAEVYASPATPFVLDFVGQSMRIRGRIARKVGQRAYIETDYGRVCADTPIAEGATVLVAVRPEHATLGPRGAEENSFDARVKETVYLGSRTQVLFESSPGDHLMAETAEPTNKIAPGDLYRIAWPIRTTLVYTEAS